MPTREEVLRDQTYKEEGMDVAKRVFYIIDEGENQNIKEHRKSKVIAMLIKTLHEKGVISESDIDEILFESVH